MIYRIGDEEYLHISDFAAMTKLTIPAVRYLCFTGGRRRLRYERDGSRLLIPLKELTEYPFTRGGRAEGIYHYKLFPDGYHRVLCRACTFKEDVELCPEAKRLYGEE